MLCRPLSPRRFTASAALFVVLLALPGLSGCVVRTSGTVDSSFEIHSLHTNDTHSYVAGMDKYGGACLDPTAAAPCTGGTGRLVAMARAAEAAGDDPLLLDAGDQFQGTLFYTVNKWPMLAELDAMVGYDAMTLGNHEFDEGCDTLADFIRALKVPVLAANLEPGPDCPLRNLPQIHPYVVRTVRGHQVGIVGLANPDVEHLAGPCPDTRFTDSAAALRKAVTVLEGQGVHCIIAVTHLGLDKDRELARAVEGVDIIVGGHTHSLLATGDTPGSTKKGAEGPYPVVETSPTGHPVLIVTGPYGTQYLGDLRVTFDKNGVPIRWAGAAKFLDAAIPPDPAVSAALARYADQLDAFRAVALGEHHLSYPDGMNACRSGDCLGGLLVSDAMLDYGRSYGAVAALTNGGSLRAPLRPGIITQGDILEVMPFGNTLLIREYTGADLLAALEFSADVDGGVGPRLLQPAGLRYAFDPALPAGRRLLSAELVDEAGNARPIKADGRYKVVLIDFLARGGDGYAWLTRGNVVSAPDPLDVDVLGAYVRKHSPLPMPKDGRINKRQKAR